MRKEKGRGRAAGIMALVIVCAAVRFCGDIENGTLKTAVLVLAFAAALAMAVYAKLVLAKVKEYERQQKDSGTYVSLWDKILRKK